MEKMKMESIDGVQSNIEKIAELFPNVITEGVDIEKSKDGTIVYRKAINFELLRQMLSNEVIDGSESYEMNWVGKKASIVEANKPIRKTLRPMPSESKDWNTTKNIYIKGDNLDVLKLLQESYLGKIKMIYIDPPYNTGHDFIYPDKFVVDKVSYDEQTDYFSEEGEVNYNRENSEVDGRFHSDWCNMIYSRLLLSKNLLTEDGVIYVSIDDYEQENLKKICSEVFGPSNFIAQLVWERAFAPKNDAKYVSTSHDYVLMFAKNKEKFKIGRLPRTEEANERYSNPDNDPRGPWQSGDLSVKTYSLSGDYPITTPSGRVIEPPAGRCWSLSKNSFLERLQDNRIWFGADGNGVPRIKRFLSELKYDGMSPTSILFYKEVGHSQEGAKEVTKLLGGGYFDGPKPTRMLKRLLTMANLKDNSIVLDFFSGSGSLADAVMQFNIENDKHVEFILAQIAEPTKKSSKALQAGFKSITEIGLERIKQAGTKLSDENPLLAPNFDFGFRVFNLDDSNMKDVYYSPSDYSQGLVEMSESNIKEDRNDLDLFFGCILDWGLPLDLPYVSEKLGGYTIHNYNDGDLIACLDENISNELVEEIASRQPMRAVFRDSSFENSPEKINVFEIFKKYMPEDADDITKRVKVI